MVNAVPLFQRGLCRSSLPRRARRCAPRVWCVDVGVPKGRDGDEVMVLVMVRERWEGRRGLEV